MRCNSGRQFPDPAIISVFDKANRNRVNDISVDMFSQRTIQITNPDPCITDPPRVCYEVAYYNFTVYLAANQSGYILASQVNYRINGISNLNGSSQVGATYTCEIPGTQTQVNASINNSAVFTGSDLVIVCAGNFFSYSFSASDPDGDQLRYTFCTAYNSSNPGVNGVAAGEPPYSPVPYSFPDFQETSPMGIRVNVDANTGMISGVAPPGGIYVVTVCVDEIRNGNVISTQRKDLQINVADCSVAAALLEDDYMVCGDTRTTTIANLSTSPLISSYDWTIFDPSGNPVHAAQANFLNYTFPVNGLYSVQLIVNKNGTCTDTSMAPVYVYPGLSPDFSFTGICKTNPTFFRDMSTVVSGFIDSWKWDFGESSIITDISTVKNPSFTYLSEGAKTARMIVTTSEGCRDTVSKTLSIIHKPPVNLAFRDTLICTGDQLQLLVSGAGSFTWSPAAGMINPNGPNPAIAPATTTKYYVDLNIEGCSNRDSVLVRVTDHVKLKVMQDTTICSNDTIRLRVDSDGLRYQWTPANQLNNAAVVDPLAYTANSTEYRVTAFIGGCAATENIFVNTVPYAVVYAGRDTIICFNTTAQLQAITDGINWAWSPASSLNNNAILNPVATPTATSAYIFTANGPAGCPKPVSDTVMVTVLPKINPQISNDTAVVVGQPLQLLAAGGDSYQWLPSFALSASGVADPIAIYHEPSDGIRYKVQVYNSAGCVDSAFVIVKVFATLPTVFVPTGFTPNNDGLNDVLRPVVAGMKQLNYFQVFNRWGQLVFSTSRSGEGWDGKVNGEVQANNVYVWMVKAVDYNGNPFFKRGTVTLVR